MRCFSCFVLLTLLASVAWGSNGPVEPDPVPPRPPSIQVDDESPEHTLVRVSTEIPGKGYSWFVICDNEFVSWVAVNGDRSSIVFTGPPGRYLLLLTVITAEGSLDQAGATTRVVRAGPEPEPEPQPEPEPDPDPPPPPPTPDAVFGVIIEERSDRSKLTPQRAMIMESAAVRALFAADCFHVRDDDVRNEDKQTPSDFKPYIDRARKHSDLDSSTSRWGPPILFLVDEKGEVLFEGSVPKDVPTAVTFIKGYLK